jgi:hypothetical protein
VKGKAQYSTIHLLVTTSLNQLHLLMQAILIFYKTSFLNEEVHRTEPIPFVSVPWSVTSLKGARSIKLFVAFLSSVQK